MHTDTFVERYIHVTYVHLHLYVDVCIHIHITIYIYIYICVCMYICTLTYKHIRPHMFHMYVLIHMKAHNMDRSVPTRACEPIPKWKGAVFFQIGIGIGLKRSS